MPVYTGDKFGFGKAPDTGGDTSAGEAFFPEPGQYDWVCPDGVTSVCAVCIGGGGGSTKDEMGGSGGGGLGYKNNIAVTPGETYKIQVGAGGVGDVYIGRYGASGGDSWFINATTVKGGGGGGTGCAADGDHSVPGYGGRGGTYVGDGGGNGGNGGDGNRSSISGTGADTGGGGAGGYSGDGGKGGDYNGNWQSGSAGNGGAGGGGCTAAGGSNEYWGGGGGGVSVYGKGRSGSSGSSQNYQWAGGGYGGSGGASGWGNNSETNGYAQVNGGQYGGGGGSTDQHGGYGGSGAVRIIWGTGREFPSTGADDFWSETITRYTAPTATDPTTTTSTWFRGGLGNQTSYSSNYNYNGIVPNISGHSNLTADITVECWIYLERLVDNTQTFGDGSDGWGAVIMDGRIPGNSGGSYLGSWWVSRGNSRRGSTGPYFLNYGATNSPSSTMTSDTECIQQCTWHHVALTRQNNVWWMWVDGVKVKASGSTGSGGEGATAQTLTVFSDRPVIGGWGYGGRMRYWSWYGNISNFRITKNLALYDGSNSTFTVPTFPLTTTLPDQGGGGVSSNSVQFSNGSDYLSVGSSSDLTMGTGDFTIECWVRFGDTANRGVFQVEGLTTNYTSTLSIAHNGSNWHGYKGGGSWNYGGSRNTNQWYHVAYVRSSGTSFIYVDGTSMGSWSDSYNYTGTTLAIGGYYTTSYLMDGNISNFRIVKGTAVYTNNFTPPTQPLTNISGTTLLCCNKSTPTGKDVGPTISVGQGSPTASSDHPFGASGPSVEVLCCGVDDDFEKDLTGSRVWSGPNCMASVLGPGAPTAEVVKKGYRIWGRHRGLGGGTKTGNNGDPGDGGLLSTWKKSTGSFQTEQFSTGGGWSASANTADGIAIKVNPQGAYASGDNTGAKWNLKSIGYGVPQYQTRNNSLGFGPFIPNVHIKVMAGKNTGDTVIYDSQNFTLRLPSFNSWNSQTKTEMYEYMTSCAFEIELPNGGANNLDMDTWYSVYIKGLAHPNGSGWNSTNGTPGANDNSFWYSESPVSYSSNSGSFNLMRYAPSTSGDTDDVEVRLEQANFNDTSWANNNHGSFNPLGQSPFFGISMPINFMKDPIPTGGGGGTTTYYKVRQNSNNGQQSYIDLGANLFPSNAYLTYTIEAWCRPLITPTGEAWVVDQHPGGNGRLIVGGNSSGNLAFFAGGWYDTSTSFGSTGSFAHLAWVANGDGSVTIFKNGISVGTSPTSLITMAPDNQNTKWGADDYGAVGCEYRGFRINSNRLYTSNFTPPSIDGGLTNISGTLALWDGLTGSATDASGNNTWSATNMTFSEYVPPSYDISSDSLMHYWNATSAKVSGNTITDETGSGNNLYGQWGTLNVGSTRGGEITVPQNTSDGWFSFGSDVTFGSGYSNQEFTFFWCGEKSQSPWWMLATGSNGDNFIGYDGSTLRIDSNQDTKGDLSYSGMSTNNLYCIYMTMASNGAMSWYVNGTHVGNTNYSGSWSSHNIILDSFNHYAMGGSYQTAGKFYFGGFYSKVLTSSEISSNWTIHQTRLGI